MGLEDLLKYINVFTDIMVVICAQPYFNVHSKDYINYVYKHSVWQKKSIAPHNPWNIFFNFVFPFHSMYKGGILTVEIYIFHTDINILKVHSLKSGNQFDPWSSTVNGICLFRKELAPKDLGNYGRYNYEISINVMLTSWNFAG